MLKLQCEFYFPWWLQMQMVNARYENLNLQKLTKKSRDAVTFK
jgi:hypothetical protein